MLRGNNALTGIVSNDLTISQKHVKGCFKEDRDDALACRFYYYGHLVGKRYDLCLTAIAKEFFISELVVGQRLMQRQQFIKNLRLANTVRRDLKNRYPWLNWY